MDKRTTTAERPIFLAVALLLVFAPIFRAGNLPLPLIGIELISLGVLLLLVFYAEPMKSSHRLPVYALLAMVAVTALYLIPLPISIWGILPGREYYLEILQQVGATEVHRGKSISLIGETTEYALWALIPSLAVFMAVINQSQESIQRLVYLVIVIAVLQSALGLMQFGGGPNSPLYFANHTGHASSASATGTYLNRDHLAGFLEMVLPVVLALLAAHVGTGGKGGQKRSRLRRQAAFFSSMEGHRAALFGVIAVLIMLGIIFTKSRAGIGLAMIGMVLALIAFSRRLGGSNTYGALGTVMAVIVVLALEVGLAPVLDRFSLDPLQDLRWTIFSTSMEGIGGFFPLGSGQGTFPSVYPISQPVEVGPFINRVHNDYLEWLFDGGILALALIVAGLFLYLRQWRRLWIGERWLTFRFIQVGAGIGILLMLLHTLVDFNLHKPANAIFFAFLAAVFFRENREEMERAPKARRKRPKPELRKSPVQTAPQTEGLNLDDLDEPVNV
jgi:hypothetical protein